MKNFDSKSIAISIITHYPRWYKGKLRSIKHTDKIRGDLSIEFVKKAALNDYQVVVADKASPKTYRNNLKKIPGLILIKRKTDTRSDGRRLVLKKTSTLPNIKIIILTEPEKISLLDSVDSITKPVFDGDAEIVVPKRENYLFAKTYPDYMYDSEVEGNILYNEILRTNKIFTENEDFDLFFGPRVLINKKNIVRLFTKKYGLKILKNTSLDKYLNFEDHSATQFFPVVLGLKKKIKIKSVTVDFKYPLIQKKNEEVGKKDFFEEKRKYQRMSILIELLYFLNYLKSGKM